MMAAKGWTEIAPCRPGTRLYVHRLWVCDGRKTFLFGREAFRSAEDAAGKAIELRRKRIDQLQRQIEELRKLGI
ncbi:hypothetical protein [Gluconacetobacter asukensis]|uniref:Uncharacterized protein n=1 Tax=Gluconacetobacter asukensis TaxID=1017181 RepID=A0A7W4NYQ3_9PROT|nr:hypothetical protein [Gluconacetobacter asukensis]MBB2170819.1 hypothetical protein [Gluconacetobacter asukensis]